LKKWQEFMRKDGITDYPEISIILNDLINRFPYNTILPRYRSILIDESQDLGTKEM
jgi:hypothetical protein